MRFTDRQIRNFWTKVDRSNPDGCWEWQGATSHRGYGLKNNLCEDGKKRLIHAHRMAWLIFRDDIPEGLMVCHKCDNRLCCNPEHLFLGTALDNTQDMIAKGRHSAPPPRERKFDPMQTKQIKALSAKGLSFRAIAKMFDTAHNVVGDVVYGRGPYKEIN